MPDKLPDNPTLGEVTEALRRVLERLEGVDRNLRLNNRLRNIALCVAALCLIAAGFSAGYAVNSRRDAESSADALRDQQHANRVALCNSARSTALAFREPQVSADGTAEPREHFIERMLAQRTALGGVVNLNCAGLPGFAQFPYLRGRAIHEIEVRLHESDPRRFPPARPDRAPPRHASTTSSSGGDQTAAKTPTESTPTEASPGPSQHADHVPGVNHAGGGGSPQTGAPGVDDQPTKASPEVPEPSGPAPATAEPGSSTTSPAIPTPPAAPATEPRPPVVGQVIETVEGVLEAAGTTAERGLEGLGGVLGPK